MSSPIELRPFRAEDLTDCLRTWRRAAERAHPFLSPPELDAERGVIRAALEGEVDVAVATAKDAVAGFIALSGASVAGLFVDPAQQGRGIGAALLRDAIAVRGALAVEVYSANTRAVAFYRRMGFRERGRRPTDDLGRPHELILLARAEDHFLPATSDLLVLRPARSGDVEAITSAGSAPSVINHRRRIDEAAAGAERI